MKMQIKWGALASSLLLAGAASAQSYPNKPVRFIVGFPPGGGSDISARVVASAMEKKLGQPVLVENRPGAGSLIGAQHVLAQPADGYTIQFGSITNISDVFIKDNPLNAARDLDPITNLQVGGLFVVAKMSLPGNTLQQVVAQAKANPGKLNFGSVGTTIDLMYAVLKDRTKMNFEIVPYKGDAPGVTALLGGEIDVLASNILAVTPHIQAGKMKPLFTTRTTRSGLLPDVPTAAEAGAPGVMLEFKLGLWAKKGTPREALQKLNAEGVAAVKTAEVIEAFRKFGADPVGSTPEQQMKTYEAEMAFWREAAKLANYQPQ
jgi:tripartite-type tricarboxylate transporter receptor subunit TctC